MPRHCPLCVSPAGKKAFPFATQWNGSRFDYFACTGCECTFVDPLPSEADFAAMYAGGYHEEHYTEATRAPYDRSVDWLIAHRPGQQRILDFGCGTGLFIAAATAQGFACAGTEHESALATARERIGVPVRTIAETIASQQRFDIIHLGDVFEHLPNPSQTLSELRQLLAPSGTFFIEGPLQRQASVVYHSANFIKRVRRALGRDRVGHEPPTHLILVSARAQRDFFQRRGWQEQAFRMWEDGWPYYHPGRRPNSTGTVVRGGIGLTAVAVARLMPALGNRFRLITQPS